MKEDKKQILANLLEVSLRSIQIKNHRKYDFTCAQYRSLFYQERFRLINLLFFSLSIKDKFVESKLLDFVRTEVSEHICNDRIMSGALAVIHDRNPSTLTSLLQSLWRVSIVYGIQRAVDVFDRLIDSNYISFQKKVLLNGLKVESEIEISAGIKLIPPSNSVADIWDSLPSFDSLGRLEIEDFSHISLLTIDCSVSPTLSKPIISFSDPFPFQMKENNEEFANIDVVDFCAMLSLISDYAIEISDEWNDLNKDELFIFEAAIRSIPNHIHTSRDLNCTTISQTEAVEAKNLYKTFINLDSNVRERLKVAVDRWIQSKMLKKNVDRMIDLGIAFEALYLGEANRDQLSFTFCVRAAWHLGENAEDRRKLMKTLKTIYKYRSIAVHTGQLHHNVTNGNKRISMRKFIENSQNLCRQSIMRVIRAGKFPDWDSLIMGENKT